MHWVKRKTAVDVFDHDSIWGMLARQRRGAGNPVGYSSVMGLRESLFDRMTAANVGDNDEALPLYDDGGGDGELDWVGSLKCGAALRDERDSSNDAGGNEGPVAMDFVSQEDETGGEGKEINEGQKSGKRRKSTHRKGNEMENPKTEFGIRVDYTGGGGQDREKCEQNDDYRLLLVGRRGQLILYKVRYKRDNSKRAWGERKQVLVEEIDKLMLETKGRPWSTGCTLKAEEIVSLGAIAIAITGFGVVLLRVLQLDGEERLFMDKVLTKGGSPETEGHWEPRRQIAGMCIVEPEGAKECVGSPVEVWVVWLNGTIKCWEIWREGGVINNAIIV